LEFGEFDMHEFEAPTRPGYLELWWANGSVLYRSPSLQGGDLNLRGGTSNSPVYRWVRLPNGDRGRAVVFTFAPRLENEDVNEKSLGSFRRPSSATVEYITLGLARSTAATEATLAELRTVLGVVGGMAIAVCTGTLWSVIRHAWRPLEDVAHQISELVSRLNDLLRRLEEAFHHERTFSANVAHELRTPLAGLRSMMEVMLSRLREPVQYQGALTEGLVITVRMQAMIENLLSLARMESGRLETEPELVFPNELLRAAWAGVEKAAQSRRLTVRWTLAPGAPCLSYPVLLELVFRNILDNAVAYADEGGRISVETAVSEEQMSITVRNTGSKLAPVQVEQAFGRFWRGDQSRSGEGIHSGLGLPLVKKATDLLGGTVAAQSEDGGEFIIVISIPCQQQTLKQQASHQSS
jgi:signal transduction histidine kinase